MYRLKENSKTKFNYEHSRMINQVVSIALCDKFISVTQSIAAFYNSIIMLRDKWQEMQQQRMKVIQPITGITQNKLMIKETLILAMVPILKSVYTYAVVSDNMVLADSVQTSYTDLHKMKYQDLYSYIQGSINTINPLVGSLADYGVTVQQVNDCQNFCTSFRNCLAETRNSIAYRVAINMDIKERLLECMHILYDRCDNLAQQFKGSNGEFYTAYISCRKLNAHSVSTQLRATVKDNAGHTLPDADVYIVGTDRSGTTDADGYCFINAIPFGWHEVALTSKNGTQNFGRFRFKKGQSRTEHFVLDALVENSAHKIKTASTQ